MRLPVLSFLLAVAAVAAPRPAHAMGVYTVLDVVAWNNDGTAALVTRTVTSSATAGTKLDYLLVGVDATETAFAFFNTTDPDTATQHVDAKACTADATALTKALAAKHFTGVTLDAGKCKTADRAVVTISADAAKDAKAARVGVQTSRAGTPREKAAWAAATAEQRDPQQPAPGGADVFAKTDRMQIVTFGESGDSSFPKYAAVYAGGKRVVASL